MHENNTYDLQTIEEKMGVPFGEMRVMAAEMCGATYNPQLLHAEQLVRGIGSLGIDGVLNQQDIEVIVRRHVRDQAQFKGVFDLPFSEQECGVSKRIFDVLLPLKHPDQYATNEMVLAEFSGKEDKEIAPTVLGVLGRLGIRNVLEVGVRHARKKRGNFHYAKWPESQVRRDYYRDATRLLTPLREPFLISSAS